MNAIRTLTMRNGFRYVIQRKTTTIQARWISSRSTRKLKSSSLPPTTIESTLKAHESPRGQGDVSKRLKPQEHQHAEPNSNTSSQNSNTQNYPRRLPFRATLADVGRGLLISLSILLCVHSFSTHLYAVTFPVGASMLPTIYAAGEVLLVSRYYRHGRDIVVGDVVCALHPMFALARQAVIKRVIGMPGDWVFVKDVKGGHMVQVPRGHCWVEGDNPLASRDSRLYGPVPLGLVTGKVTWRLWPPRRMGRIENTLKEVPEDELGNFVV